MRWPEPIIEPNEALDAAFLEPKRKDKNDAFEYLFQQVKYSTPEVQPKSYVPYQYTGTVQQSTSSLGTQSINFNLPMLSGGIPLPSLQANGQLYYGEWAFQLKLSTNSGALQLIQAGLIDKNQLRWPLIDTIPLYTLVTANILYNYGGLFRLSPLNMAAQCVYVSYDQTVAALSVIDLSVAFDGILVTL
jgi:hypothetical protein